MRKRLLGVVVAALLIGTPAASPPVAPAKATQTATIAKSCGAGYTHAVINRSHKCLRRGQYCSMSAKRQYRRYGFRCVNGRLR